MAPWLRLQPLKGHPNMPWLDGLPHLASLGEQTLHRLWPDQSLSVIVLSRDELLLLDPQRFCCKRLDRLCG